MAFFVLFSFIILLNIPTQTLPVYSGSETDSDTVYGTIEDKARALGQYSGREERKRKNLIRLGVDQDHAYAWSRTRKGGWAVAQSPILITTITLSRLRRKGYESMLSYYLKSQPTIQ
ncbi:hypothetical protein [Echinicola salinicaeni]|uniref:hypothetical protein n=1 Tax=Echinicola salinicaeni TaxID=2762757 RepID=UPI001E316A44|nr:hypothetical protein [Echinicola salinicaeni]